MKKSNKLSKNHKRKKFQLNGKKKTDWIFWLEVIQTAIAIYNIFF